MPHLAGGRPDELVRDRKQITDIEIRSDIFFSNAPVWNSQRKAAIRPLT